VLARALRGFWGANPCGRRPLRQAIKHCVEHKHSDRVWYTRAGDIAKYCFSLSKGVIPGSLTPQATLFRLQLGGLDRVVELRLLAIDLRREFLRGGAVRLDPERVQLRDGGRILRGRDDMPGELVDDLRRGLGRNEEPVPAFERRGGI